MTVLSIRHEIRRRDLETLRGGFGPLLCARLDDDNVTDLMLNGNGTLFEDRKGIGLVEIGTMSDHDHQSRGVYCR